MKQRPILLALAGVTVVAIAVLLWPTAEDTNSASQTTATIAEAPVALSCKSDTPQGEKPGMQWPGMQWIEGGSFQMGTDAAYREESPVRTVSLDGYWIDRHETTNRKFTQFISETNYITVAERVPNAADIPGAPPEMLLPGSAMFRQPAGLLSTEMMQWWIYQPGANWRHPEGPGSSIDNRMEYPVVHIAFEDAQAYAAWVGKDLPTEAQWEFAARSKLDGSTYAWGEVRLPEGKHLANTWQGLFPLQNTEDDGYAAASPVGCFPPNAYGLHDMIGNVWEWTADRYAPRHTAAQTENPIGPSEEQSYAPNQPGFPVRVIKGGSFLCAPNYCMRYRPAARQAQDTGLGSDHIGFRTVINSM